MLVKPGPEPPNLSGVSGAAGVVIKDAIFLMGGQLTNRRYPQEILGMFFVALNLELKTKTVLWPHSSDWQRIGEMRLARRGFHTAFLNGNLYVIGGNDKQGNEVFDMAEFYDRQVCTEPNRNWVNTTKRIELELTNRVSVVYPRAKPHLDRLSKLIVSRL